MLKKIIYVLLFLLLALQFVRPDKNISGDTTFAIQQGFPVPENVSTILKDACNDCHTNKTEYPWYSNIQPLGWWLNDHIVDGKKHFNLDNFMNYRAALKLHKLEELDEVIESGEMPMTSYITMHEKADLSEDQKNILIQWSKSLQDTLRNRYPADSLILRRKKK